MSTGTPGEYQDALAIAALTGAHWPLHSAQFVAPWVGPDRYSQPPGRFASRALTKTPVPAADVNREA